MEWLSVLILLVLLYTLISVYVVLHNRAYQRQLLKSETTQDDRADEKEPGEETGDWIYDHISFFGPIMAIRTHKVGIFDFFVKIQSLFSVSTERSAS